MPVFVHAQGIKTVNAKLCPRKDWIPKKPNKSISMIFNGETFRNDFIFYLHIS
jgi:hypothetical protein